jgi:hypothetical protein
VKNDSVKDIDGVNVVLYKENGESVVLEIDGEEGTVELTNLDGGDVEFPKQGEVITYVYTSSERFKKMEVYPVIKGKICEMSDEIEIVSCVPGVLS